MDKEKSTKQNNKKIANSFINAINGFKVAYKKERNLKIHIIIMCLVIICGFVLKINATEWIICLILFALVISEELINTAIEEIVNIIMPEINVKAKFIKDVSAGAVFFSSIISVIIGLIIFIPKLQIFI